MAGIPHIDIVVSGLSTREVEVLELAAQGLIDEQIAQSLGIRTSTVSSYWVRIRGKLGQHSRTELVAGLVTSRAESRERDLGDEVAQLRAEVQRLRKEQAGDKLPLGLPGVGWERKALDCAPEAILLVEESGTILYANDMAARLFQCLGTDLVDTSFTRWVATQQRHELLMQLNAVFDSVYSGRVALGAKFPLFGRRSDGDLFRALVSVETVEIEGRRCAVCIFLDFMTTLDVRRRAIAAQMIMS